MKAIETYYGPNGPNDSGTPFDASSFLGFLRRSNPVWQSNSRIDERQSPLYRGHTEDINEQRWVYRGQANSDWKLVPSAARLNSSLQPLVDKFLEDLTAHSAWSKLPQSKRVVAANILAYLSAINDFVRFGHKMGFIDEPGNPNLLINGLPFPNQDQNGRTSMGHHSLSDKMALGGGPYPLGWDSTTALAQHHGIPTFLLDWTENPWFAAHFAATPSMDFNDANDICVWALDIKKVDDGAFNAIGGHGIGSVLVNRPARSENHFLASQDGLLTFLLDDGEYWEKTGSYLHWRTFL